MDVAPEKRDVAVAVIRPDTRAAQAVRITSSGTGAGAAGGGAGPSIAKSTYVVADPGAGVWEVRLSDLADANAFDAEQAEKAGPAPATKVTLTVSALAVDAAATADDGGAAPAVGTSTLSITNRMAEFTGSAVSVPVGSARRERPTIREKEQQVYEVDVPAGSTMLLARVTKPTAPGADLDVYVFDCTGKQCKPGRSSAEPFGDESVIVQNRCRCRVDSFRLDDVRLRRRGVQPVLRNRRGRRSRRGDFRGRAAECEVEHVGIGRPSGGPAPVRGGAFRRSIRHGAILHSAAGGGDELGRGGGERGGSPVSAPTLYEYTRKK